MDKHDEWTDRIVDTFFEGNTREFMKGYVRRYLVTAASEATREERERCAAIARAEFTSPGWSGAGECIATAIEKEPG